MKGIQAQLIGRLGHDPEMSYHPDSGDAIVSLRVAVRDYAQGEERTEWVRCRFWRNHAEFMNNHARKGARISVNGRLRKEEYTRRDGSTGSGLQMDPYNYELLDWPDRSGATTDDAGQTAPAAAAPEAAAGDETDVDELPF